MTRSTITPHWQTTRFRLPLDEPVVMGIVNVTPDSFSDGGQHADPDSAIAHCERLVAEGAHILDIGGESTRPGASAPSVDEEWARVEPVLRAALQLGVPVSLDSSRAEVMRAALDQGVDIVNDVRALQGPGCLDLLAQHGQAGVCLMHMQGEPRDMQAAPRYANDDVVADVLRFWQLRVQAATEAGISSERIVLDPGIGFGKTPSHNWTLLKRQTDLLASGLPLLLGWSRKSTLGLATGRSVAADRVAASTAAALLAVQRGARIVRVHDVAATVDVLKVWAAAKET